MYELLLYLKKKGLAPLTSDLPSGCPLIYSTMQYIYSTMQRADFARRQQAYRPESAGQSRTRLSSEESLNFEQACCAQNIQSKALPCPALQFLSCQLTRSSLNANTCTWPWSRHRSMHTPKNTPLGHGMVNMAAKGGWPTMVAPAADANMYNTSVNLLFSTLID